MLTTLAAQPARLMRRVWGGGWHSSYALRATCVAAAVAFPMPMLLSFLLQIISFYRWRQKKREKEKKTYTSQKQLQEQQWQQWHQRQQRQLKKKTIIKTLIVCATAKSPSPTAKSESPDSVRLAVQVVNCPIAGRESPVLWTAHIVDASQLQAVQPVLLLLTK